jgi:hypothetical protein
VVIRAAGLVGHFDRQLLGLLEATGRPQPWAAEPF